MKKDLTDLQILGLTLVAIACITLSHTVLADEMVQKFKSPSFNGMGISAHYLTIENQETNRKDEAKEALQAALDEAERDLENTTLARFMKNLESRIYSQLSRDLVDNLFADGIGTEAAGVIEDSLFEEALAVKKQQLIDSGLAIEDVNKQIFELRYQNEIERVQREIDLEQMKIDAKKNINQEYISWVQGLSSIFKTIAGENEGLAKVGVILEQGAAIAGIVIRTQAANAKIKAEAGEQASVTQGAGAAALAKAALLSASGNFAQGAVYAAAGKGALATSAGILTNAKARVLKNNIGSGISIAKILATNLGSGSSNGGGGGDTGGGGASAGRTFDFNLVGNTGVNQLAQGIGSQFDQPIQAYVVSSQMTSQQQMDATIQSNASIG